MVKFKKKVDLNSREQMVKFLSEHFRYSTMNSWNQSTSYANDVKITNIGLSYEQVMKLFDIIGVENAYDEVNELIAEFAKSHDYKWQVGFNGRSSGYLVLYQGGSKDSEYKSFCPKCGQRNYRKVEETGCKCGRCGQDTRINYINPPKEIFTYPGKSVDMDEDFEEFSDNALKDRVKLITEFDELCDKIVELAADMADNFAIEEEEIYIPRTVKKLVRI